MRYAHGLLELARPVPRAMPRPQVHRVVDNPILRLQQTAGNAVVQRLIQVQRDKQRDAARDQQLSTALAGGDWTGAANVLLPADESWMIEKVRGLPEAQLRYLDDAVVRLGVHNSRLRTFINASLMEHAMKRGAKPDTSRPGAAYGVIEGKAVKVTDGKIQPGGNQAASYRFEITFTPNPQVVNATLIEFIQMATVVSTVNTAPDPVGVPVGQNAGANGPNRQTADHARIDRITGMNQGWIGVGNNGVPINGHLRPWTPGSKQPAWMEDTPSRTVPNVSFNFETAAVCRSGKDQGMVYATVKWGFTIDAAMKVIPKDPVYFNKESSDFDLAVIFWNTEAARPGNAQLPLPTNLH